MTNEEIFIAFLKYHDKVESFKHSIDMTRYRCYPNNVKKVIDGGFYWGTSPEGSEYWRKIESKWKKMVKDMALTGNIDLALVKGDSNEN